MGLKSLTHSASSDQKYERILCYVKLSVHAPCSDLWTTVTANTSAFNLQDLCLFFFSTFMFVALLFSVCSWKWKRICRLISPFCVHWLKIMLSLARCSLSRKVLPTWRADSPESFRTLGELGEQLKKINLNVLCEAMSTNRSIQGDIVLCALAFKQYGEEQRGKEE